MIQIKGGMYITPKKLTVEELQKFVSKMIQFGKENNFTVRFISYLYEKDNKIWFKGFQSHPYNLTQSVQWCNTVVTDNNSIVVDLTKGLNTVVFNQVFKVIQNPQRFMFNNSSLVTYAS